MATSLSPSPSRTLSENKFKGKVCEADREKLKKAINETIEFLDATQSSASEEYSDKQKELESFSNPILMKFYGVSGGFPVAGEGAAHCGGKCPTVVEVD
ncbi:hypothetical protein B0I72DRAFT_157144 [Yarrowia lipolytica]|jgi:heat shock protein 1/8|uniref:YALI0E29491p n=2 Tax=Yarrowia lipolytica TaxID=4952 RepID=Q6C458_YARLI|nr:YALI0E29491p [Yarrowia lipolytica CLIB122]AOW06138.1 hypothetical protein YALI1_E34880g [Yarrowia lipolytica]KAE8175321.1 hypothetical protein BKA90DRAFT_150154 [Yarrowia lipolytica]QNP99851.1 Heat shock protein SSA4 [Yarrowia lipolytica]RDW34433.1 hypothetical protein B0I72DRAFT_157144 [Yarrowia lipolytica]RDW44294.1 hypothetical protein B0I74DRAFT_159938 [Yarrowia lipolytica]|eukprot:XP_504554.1 YALI0E29491p [Yarrowia lipolytica CLIB122]